MKVSHEVSEDLSGVLKVHIDALDYAATVTNKLNIQRKKADMPGFRKGHVPMGMVRKMYGSKVLGDEINQILGSGIDRYIRENKLPVLGQPIPISDPSMVLDVNNMGDVVFSYKIGVAPQIKVEVSEKDKFTMPKIKVDEKLIEKYSDDVRRQYGKFSSIEKAGEADMLNGVFTELNETGEIKEGGITHKSTISIEFVEDAKLKKTLMDLTKGDVVTLNPKDVSKGDEDLAKMLNIGMPQVMALSTQFSFVVEDVFHVEPSDLNEELFEKLYGKDTVKTIPEFHGKITEELEKIFVRYQDIQLYKDIKTSYLKKFDHKLPDAFLKEFLAQNKEYGNESDVETAYEGYSESLKWNLIESEITKKYELAIDQEEIMAYTKESLKGQFAQYGMADPDEKLLNDTALNVMKNEEEYRKVYEDLYFAKMMTFYKKTLKLKDKAVSYDEFVKLATGEAPKKGFMGSLSNLFA
ncbi:MAG: trigger factor [Salibacteraceae bacterium]|jgi:trigger factor